MQKKIPKAILAVILTMCIMVPAGQLKTNATDRYNMWKNGAVKGGYGLSNTDVEMLLDKYKGKVTFDQASKSPKAEIYIGLFDPKPYVLGKPLETGSYTIWYENEASIKYKLDLVNKYDLKGTGSWSLGQETPETWNYYKLWLNGHYFKDVQGHWAQGAILSMYDKKWMTGVGGVLFAPDQPLTRAEAAVILVRALGLAETGIDTIRFDDISSHWAEAEIRIAAENGVVQGTGNNHFSPGLVLTRQEMAVMLDRIIKSADGEMLNENPYSDISEYENPWSYTSILKLSHLGIFTGNPDGSFQPAGKTTRAQMAVLMDRLAGYFNSNVYVLANR